jgi:hypothetical protein
LLLKPKLDPQLVDDVVPGTIAFTVENDTVCYRKIAPKNSFCDILRSLIGDSQNFLAALAAPPSPAGLLL